MKKIKLLTSLCSVGVIATTVPTFTINCSKTTKNIDEVVTYEDYITNLDLPHVLFVESTYSSQMQTISSTGTVVPNVKYKIEEATTADLNAIINGITVIFSPSLGTEGKECVLEIGAYVNNEKIASLTHRFNNIFYADNVMKWNDVEYELVDNIDPDVFVSSSDFSYHVTKEIPLKNGKKITMKGTFDGWDGITSVRLRSLDPKARTIPDYFLTDCHKLKEVRLLGDLSRITSIGDSFLAMALIINYVNCVDLSGFKNLTSIGKKFLSGSSIYTVILPNESAADIKDVDTLNMRWVNTLQCGSHLHSYQTIYPWSDFADWMIGTEHNYAIKDLEWSPYSNPIINKTVESELILLDDGLKPEPRPYDWKIEEGTDECLNAKIDSLTHTISITPNADSICRTNTLKIAAYFKGVKTAELTKEIKVVNTPNKITYNGRTYDIAYELSPNLFTVFNSLGWFLEQQIPLDNGIAVLNVGGDEKGWKKITSLSLKSVNSNVTTIEPHFLHSCRNLTTLDLSGLTSIRYIDSYFLCLCLNLTSLTLPNISPRLITVKYNFFLADVPSSTVFHCGQYLEEYKNTFPWSLRADQMVE